MNRRIKAKQKKKVLLLLLQEAVSSLDENNGKYKARAIRIPSAEVRILTHINGYGLEIRSSHEDDHNYAHFHVVKGRNGMASIRIDNLEVIKSSLSNKELKRILEWASDNRELLVNVWNEFHGHRIVVE